MTTDLGQVGFYFENDNKIMKSRVISFQSELWFVLSSFQDQDGRFVGPNRIARLAAFPHQSSPTDGPLGRYTLKNAIPKQLVSGEIPQQFQDAIFDFPALDTMAC